MQNVQAVLDALVRRKMLRRETVRSGLFYRLTPAAVRYFFAENRHGDNPDALPYLCYSSIVPDSVTAIDRRGGADGNDRTAAVDASFTWHASPPAAWAADDVIRAHTVILAPTRSPVVATFVSDHAELRLEGFSPFAVRAPKVADASAWSRR